MNSLGIRSRRNPHDRRLLVDEAEWRDRLDQLAEMRRHSLAPVAAGAATAAAPDDGHIGAKRELTPQVPEMCFKIAADQSP
jgi:hypothetical protein